MVGSRWRRGGPAAQLLGAVVAYLRLLDAEWESLDDTQRRSAIRLALEAVGEAPWQSSGGDAARLASHPADGFPPEDARAVAHDRPGRPNA